jgi:hypothetical protein
MNHAEAVRLSLVEKYLLDELGPELRDEFEEHYFDCSECAVDLRAASAFLDAAMAELSAAPAMKPAPSPAKKPWFAWLWTPAFVVPALAACLLVIAYQNLVIFPRFRNALAELRSPEILPVVSLVGGNSRGGVTPAITLAGAHAFLVSIDIPTQERFSSYSCLLYSPAGALAWRVLVSAEEAKDAVSIRVPAKWTTAGSYTLAVLGNTGPSSENGVELARYRFTLTQ